MKLRKTLLLGCVAFAACAAPAMAKDYVIHAGTLIDAVANAPRHQVSILVHDDKIASVQDGFVTPQGAEVVDLSHSTVLPGLIDCHDHVTGGGPHKDPLRNTASFQAMQSVWNVKAILQAGFTSVRDVGGDIEVLVALEDAINRGVFQGPRLTISGPAVSPTGGHGDASNGIDPEWDRHDDWKMAVIDGPDQAVHAVRELKKRGAQVIKIVSSGGVGSVGDDPTIQMLSDAELVAIMTTAHSLKLKVASHAHGKAGIDAAIRAGVDSIEHGTYSDDETYRLMKEHGTFLIPTLFAAHEIYEVAKAHPEMLPPTVADKAIAVTPVMDGNAANAYKAGVKMALGTDQLGFKPHGSNAMELQYLVADGIKPFDALMMGTRNAAELLGKTAEVGSIQPGRFADIIAVDGDPLADIKIMQNVQFVMKGGTVYKTNGKAVI